MKTKNLITAVALLGIIVPATSQAAVELWRNTNFDGTFTEAVNSTHPSRWGFHDDDTNIYLNNNNNGSLIGNVVGHIGNTDHTQGAANSSYRNYANQEQSIYTMQVDLTGVANNGLKLMFNFDSWIYDDNIDGFNIAAYTGTLNNSLSASAVNASGTNSDLVAVSTALAGSDMIYRNLTHSNNRLDDTNGYSSGFNGDGAAGDNMHGVAMFDLSGLGLAGNSSVNLRFAFGSSNSNTAEGINIDKIKIIGNCVAGSTAIGGSHNGCDDPPSGGNVPEPTTLALSILGLSAVYRRRRKA